MTYCSLPSAFGIGFPSASSTRCRVWWTAAAPTMTWSFVVVVLISSPREPGELHDRHRVVDVEHGPDGSLHPRAFGLGFAPRLGAERLLGVHPTDLLGGED